MTPLSVLRRIRPQVFKRVAPGDPGGSILYQLMMEGGENLLHVNHVEIFSSQFKDGLANLRTMIERWINFVCD